MRNIWKRISDAYERILLFFYRKRIVFLISAEALALARLTGCQAAVLKARSPSCGGGTIYDGSFTGTLVPGNGVAADLLLKNGLPVFSEKTLDRLDQWGQRRPSE